MKPRRVEERTELSIAHIFFATIRGEWRPTDNWFKGQPQPAGLRADAPAGHTRHGIRRESAKSELQMTRISRIPVFSALVVAGLTVAAAPAHGFEVSFSGSGTGSGTVLNAQATFGLSGIDLKVTLTNTSLDDVLDPPDVLTGVFFDIVGNPSLIPSSAVPTAGSVVLFPPSGDGAGDVAGE